MFYTRILEVSCNQVRIRVVCFQDVLICCQHSAALVLNVLQSIEPYALAPAFKS